MIDRKRNVDLDITGINSIWFDEVSGKVSHFKKVPQFVPAAQIYRNLVDTTRHACEWLSGAAFGMSASYHIRVTLY